MRNLYLLFLLSLLSTITFAAHVHGKLTDESGEFLPFASIYIKGTSIGTTSNIDGMYDIELEAGTYELVFQYVGYASKVENVTVGDEDIELNVVLGPIANNIQEIVITAGEDPAYRVIRKAIKKRRFYQNQVKKYSCDTYVKGRQHVRNLPKSFMGQSLEAFRQGLDSTGSGIIYLSESISKLHYKDGAYKEIMSSSKVSGNDNGFSFNSAGALAGLSFYQNMFELGDTKILSPIANNALGSYKYRMETSFYDNDGHLVYKIEVIPKNKLGALFSGYIYIVDEHWAIHSTDLFTTGKAVNISVLDTVYFKQTHINLGEKTWRLFTQEISFSLKLLLIRTQGEFIGVFKNYDLNPKFPPKFFDAEVFKVEDLANKKLSTYWDSIRPVPLSKEETVEYKTKDSLQRVWESKAYKDSMDREANKPKIFDLITGYTFQNSYHDYKFTIHSPINTLHFNTVQGQILGIGFDFVKGLKDKKDRKQSLKLHAEGEYSFHDKQFRGFGYMQMRFSPIRQDILHVEGGRYKRQFNPRNPVPLLVNTYYTLLGKLNYIKFYDEYYGRVTYAGELFNGFYLNATLKYAQRHALVNSTDFAWVYEDPNRYFSNHPQDLNRPTPYKDVPSFKTHEALAFVLSLRIRPGQKYITYPNRRFYQPTKFPDIWITYARGIPFLGGDTNYDYLELKVEKNDIPIGTVGLLSFKATGGWFPYKSNMFFMDYYHFNGNQTFIAKSNAYLSTFQLLPYYEYSTNTGFGMLHVEHDFNGFIWNKIPGLKQLGFEFVAGYHFLYTPEKQEYMEFTLGLDRIGWNLLRFLRVDFVMGYKVGEPLRYGGVVGITLSL